MLLSRLFFNFVTLFLSQLQWSTSPDNSISNITHSLIFLISCWINWVFSSSLSSTLPPTTALTVTRTVSQTLILLFCYFNFFHDSRIAMVSIPCKSARWNLWPMKPACKNGSLFYTLYDATLVFIFVIIECYPFRE